MRIHALCVSLAALTAASAACADTISTVAAASYANKEATYGYWGPYNGNYDGGDLGWGESYVLMGAISMYEATGNTAHLVKVLDHGDRILANRSDKLGVLDQKRGTLMPGWVTDTYTPGVQYAWTVHAGMVTAPIARAVYDVRKSPTLSATYGTRTNAELNDLIQTAAGYEVDWRELSGNRGYYIDDSGVGAAPWNQSNAMGRTMINLYLATGEVRFRERAEKLANYFKANLRTAGGGTRYVWSYQGNSSTSYEDISHAAINADFAFASYRAGIVFTAADMTKFAATYSNLLQGASGASDTVAGGTPLASSPGLAGMWGNLGAIDPATRNEFYQYYSTYTSMGGGSWGMSVAGYLVAAEQPVTFDTPVAQPRRQTMTAPMDSAGSLFTTSSPGTRSSGLNASSNAARSTSIRQFGGASMQVNAVDSSTTTGGWKYELTPGSTMTIDRAGYVGLWARTADSSTNISLLMSDADGVEQSWLFNLPADNLWHFYQWNLDDAAQWNPFSGGNGVLTGLRVNMQSILIGGTSDANATVYLDALSFNRTGTIAGPLGGDTDIDGDVDFSDLLALAQHYDAASVGWVDGDFDNNGLVNFSDLLTLAQRYGTSGLLSDGTFPADVAPDFAADWALAQSLLPEPCAMAFIGLGGLLYRRRRRA